jgi:phosphorylcholine metabolism protein LicD
LPDYKVTQLVYSDNHLPAKNLKERLIPYYKRSDTLVAYENELYDDIISNQVFPFFSNSFFIEVSKSGEFCDVEYAAISTDRGDERGFATTVHKDGTVRKQSLYPEGKCYARQIYDNVEDLRAHGIPVVRHVWKNDTLEMPYIKAPTLSNHIKAIIDRNTDEFIELVDQLYGYILKSSEHADKEDNRLLLNIREDKRKEAGVLDWGPVLRRAYIELIPLNCFYDEGKFLFFDQEFVKEYYPAKYVLFRALHYIYAFTPNAERIIPLSDFKDKYSLNDLWEYFLEEENRFLKEVRRHDVYKQFYKWSKIDWTRMLNNSKLLESEEEIVANYKVSDKMKRIWRTELQILDAVEVICKRHNIEYFIIHGTLIGAIRHKGFIPWDDDLDIGMHREDYDRFLEAAARELPEPYYLQTADRDADCYIGGIARIRDSRTTAIETKDFGHNCNLGLWIDILPLDSCTEDEDKLKKKQKKIRHSHRLLYAKVYGRDFKQFADMKPLLWNWYRLLSSLYGHRRLCRRLDRAMRLYTDEKTDHVAFFSGYYKHRPLARKDFETTVMLEFENRRVPAPGGYEDYLFMTFGRDYLKYPPEEERKPKHRGIFDPDRPYLYYQERFFDTFKNIKDRDIILFGAGMMFEDYMNKYGDKYRPSFLVDNDKNKWGRTRMGIPIKEPEAIIQIPESKRKIIICSFYYNEIEDQLKRMGIRDYSIYIQEKEWVLQTEEVKK